jgi:hypothetical protein
VSPYLRMVKTASGATAVQIVHSSRRGSRDIEHIGSAHDDAGVELLKAAARQRLYAGQGELDLGLEVTEPARKGAGGGPLPITASRMGHLIDALFRAYDVLGFGRPAAGDEVFRDLVLARIIEPVSKLDSLRVLEEAGLVLVSRLHRSPPDDRLRRPRGRSLDRAADWLVHQEIRQNRPPLSRNPDQGRQPHHHRRRPHTRRPPPRHRRHQAGQLTCALI